MQNTTIIQKLQAKKNKKGFTLVELVIVIAILAILAAIAIPVIISTISSANESTFKSDTATMEMLVKASVNEAKSGLHTQYTDATDSTKKKDIADGDVTIADIAVTNGFSGSFFKETGSSKFAMYWDGKTLSVVDTEVTGAPTGDGAKTGYVTKGATIKENGDIASLSTNYSGIVNIDDTKPTGSASSN